MFKLSPFAGLSDNLQAMKAELDFQLHSFIGHFKVLLQVVKAVATGKVVLVQPLLVFQEDTSSGVALKRSGNTLQVRLGDDSAYAPLWAKTLALVHTIPTIQMQDTAGGTDAKWWDWMASGGSAQFRAVNDAYTAANPAFQMVRSGYTITRLKLYRACQALPNATDDANLAPSNLDMYFYLQSNTSLRVRVKGSDGTVREGTITLS